MIKRAHELRIKREPRLKGGNKTVEVINFLEEGESSGAGRLFGVSIIPEGGSIGYHRHEGDFEIYYLLEGLARVNDHGEEAVLQAGDCMICRDGCCHSIENIGGAPLKYVALILYSRQSSRVTFTPIPDRCRYHIKCSKYCAIQRKPLPRKKSRCIISHMPL